MNKLRIGLMFAATAVIGACQTTPPPSTTTTTSPVVPVTSLANSESSTTTTVATTTSTSVAPVTTAAPPTTTSVPVTTTAPVTTVPVTTTTAPAVTQRNFRFYSDSLGAEASPYIGNTPTVKWVSKTTMPGKALCDALPSIRNTLKTAGQYGIVLSYAGNKTSCVTARAAAATPEAVADVYAADVAEVIALARTTGTKVVLMDPPAMRDAYYRELSDALEVRYSDLAAANPDIATFAITPNFDVFGTIPRAADGVHFCPGTMIPSYNALYYGVGPITCTVTNHGAVMWASAVKDAAFYA